MSHPSGARFARRTFLRALAAAGMVSAVSACGAQPASTVAPNRESVVPDMAAYLAVMRGEDPAAITTASIDALGGMGRFVKAGDDVIIKPNICVAYHTYEYAATTNPVVVGTLVRLCMGAGAKRVRVMDSPFGGTSEQAYEKSGIAAEVSAAGCRCGVLGL